MSKRVSVASDLAYNVNAPSSFLFQIAVASTEHQTVESESISVEPFIPLEICQAGLLGNKIHRLSAQPGSITIRYRAEVILDQKITPEDALQETPHAALPGDVLPFINPSRYCESDRLLKLAWDEFGAMVPGHARVAHIVDWVHDHLDYLPGTTGPNTTACDVLVGRAGVCRDYAHVTIALLRALGVPARYVAGYAVDLQPPDFHGFCEAWLGDDWYLFDATKLAPVSGFVRIGAGRDAADVSFATFFGAADSFAPVVLAQLTNDQPAASSDGNTRHNDGDSKRHAVSSA